MLVFLGGPRLCAESSKPLSVITAENLSSIKAVLLYMVTCGLNFKLKGLADRKVRFICSIIFQDKYWFKK